MKKIHTIRRYVPLCAGMLMLFSSCEHKDLCFDHDPHATKSEVRIEAEYEKEWQYTHGEYGLEELSHMAGIVRYGIQHIAPGNAGWVACASVQYGRFR